MTSPFLGALLAEWFAWRGFDVVLDDAPGAEAVLALKPGEDVLYHVEASTGTEPWPKRRARLVARFAAGEAAYEHAFDGEARSVERIAVVEGAPAGKEPDLGDEVRVVRLPSFLHEVGEELASLPQASGAVPEGYPLLRAMHHALWGAKARSRKR